ncbi:SMEK domain-containing protein [Photobacterium kishitanii]|uniref:SMEK domain-containing protein n=1 Tax=Photobacterium kishitanii TaxID=318456 RepID=A0A2T3KEF1_9GAMM|nr:SMEK domain-containing protein [Photobacterium kishitanii]PSU95696.1 hypothetical protein C9J27_17635 [Photobacterium kishitanii]
MTRQELLQQSSAFLGRFAHEVKVANAMGQFDINTIAEDFLIPILAITLKCPDLRNQNRIRMNFPAVDLGCDRSRISIQITSDPSSSKVCETLKKFDSYNLSCDFDKIYVYVITERQKSYTSKELIKSVKNLSINFEPSNDILDYNDLAKLLNELNNKDLEYINEHLKAEFERADDNLQFRSNLDEFLRVNQLKIEDEKRTKKYIPSVFVETSEIKDEMRYFANPMFFYRKIDDDIRRINWVNFNELLRKAKVDPIVESLVEIIPSELPCSLYKLQERLQIQSDKFEVIQKNLSLFSWYGEQKERFVPKNDLLGYWKVFKYSIESSGSGLFHSMEKVTKKIRITQTKVFLITGMAGQGKTNFICDLIENQFKVFEIPTIFIPARALNDYSNSNRILSYIKNNRYAPASQSLHELLSLLNKVAEECQKPFIIAIDGINEVGDLDGFAAELRVFLNAMCQYEYIKIVISCRNEFFEHKFAHVFDCLDLNIVYRVKDLRKEMSDENKDRLFDAYLIHFKIKGKFSKIASDFLKNDLILLRIFSEINENKNIGYIPDIYKGDIFEQYLMMKINEFPKHSRQSVLNSLYKICHQMLEGEIFSQIPVEGFDESEMQIIEQLIGEDIILRREVPPMGLASLGLENISFTYDELRDFLLAFYTVNKLSVNQLKVNSIFEKIIGWPIYEGFFRYAYLLARKQGNDIVLFSCESSKDFLDHYLNNLSLLPADIQSPEDVIKVKDFLTNNSQESELRSAAWFLFSKKDESNYLNIKILLDHVSKLDEVQSEHFMKAMFSGSSYYLDDGWRDDLSYLLNSLKNLKEKQQLGLGRSSLAMILHFVPYANWDVRETILNFFVRYQHTPEISDAIEACRNAASIEVQNCLAEIEE